MKIQSIPSLLALGLSLPLACQQVQVTAHALTPLEAQVLDAAGPTTATQPAGALPFNGNIVASPVGGFDLASVGWMLSQSATRCEALIDHTMILADPTITPGCSLGRHELLVEFTASAPITARLQLVPQQVVTAGATAPALQLDIGNDGTIDVVDVGVMAITTQTVTLGMQPLQVRLVADATLSTPGLAQCSLTISLLPDNDLTIQKAVTACRSGDPSPPLVEPTFAGRGIRLWQPFPGVPAVMVVGHSAQPIVLSVSAGLPCLLLPSPDLVLFAPSGFLDAPIPATVRPLTLHVQAVMLEDGSLATGDGYTVSAY